MSALNMFSGFFKIAILTACVGILWKYGRGYFLNKTRCPTHGGFVHPDFDDVRQAFIQNILSGYAKGAAFSVYHRGQPLVDLWGGCADLVGSSKSWGEDTLTQAWSTTKGVTAVTLGHLVSRGRLNYTTKVAEYWPEFAQNGKENLTVAMVLSHQSGLSNLRKQITLYDYRDAWDEVESMMAEQKPLWKPGSTYNYHAFTYGMYADAIIRRVDEKHRNISKYFEEEIADLFDIDFFIGLPESQYVRSTVAAYTPFWGMYLEFLLRPDNWPFLGKVLSCSDILYQSMQVVDFVNDFDCLNQKDMRTVGLSSSHGFGTARSLAKLFDYVANNGTINGRTMLTPEIASAMAMPITDHIPVIAAPRFPFSSLGNVIEPNRNGHPTVGHRGYGGQHAYGDLQYQVGVSFLTNDNHGSGDVEDPRITNVLDALYKNLEKFNMKSVG